VTAPPSQLYAARHDSTETNGGKMTRVYSRLKGRFKSALYFHLFFT